MFDPKATASHLDLYEGAAVKGFRWRLAILIDSSWLLMRCAVKSRSREAVRQRRRT